VNSSCRSCGNGTAVALAGTADVPKEFSWSRALRGGEIAFNRAPPSIIILLAGFLGQTSQMKKL